MKLTSPVFEHKGAIPTLYTCDGSDTSPPLDIHDIPAEAKSLVLIMEDPDVPRSVREDGMWDHWILFNIPPHTTHIPAGQEPEARHGLGTGETTSYHGPCPPDREHRYFFKLYALDTILNVPDGVGKGDIVKVAEGHVIAETQLMGTYERV